MKGCDRHCRQYHSKYDNIFTYNRPSKQKKKLTVFYAHSNSVQYERLSFVKPLTNHDILMQFVCDFDFANNYVQFWGKNFDLSKR